MRQNCLRLAAALVATSAVLTAQTPAVAGAVRAQRFDSADREAQSVAWVIECAQMSARAGRVPTIVTGTYASTLAGNAWMQMRQRR